MAAKGIWKVNRSQRLLIPRTLRVPLFSTGNLLQEQNASKVNKIDVSSSPTSWEIFFLMFDKFEFDKFRTKLGWFSKDNTHH